MPEPWSITHEERRTYGSWLENAPVWLFFLKRIGNAPVTFFLASSLLSVILFWMLSCPLRRPAGADELAVLVRGRLLRPNEGCFEVREDGFVFEFSCFEPKRRLLCSL